MSYTPTTDFLALLRTTSNGQSLAEMPGLDFVVAALARAGQFTIYTGQTQPTTNQTTTVWIKPAQPSWTAEGTVYLWSSAAGAFQPATPALWTTLLSPASAQVFQSTSLAADTVDLGVTLFAVERINPVTTAITLPPLASRGGAPLHVVDWSSNVANHQITLTTPDNVSIMRRLSWSLRSTADQLTSVSLYPSVNLNGWVIA
jgi:hypothetical protein